MRFSVGFSLRTNFSHAGQIDQIDQIDHDPGHLDPNLPSRDVVQDLRRTDPTQETQS